MKRQTSTLIRVRLQPHNRKFEGEFEILPGSEYDAELEAASGYDSVLVSCCVTTMHHDTRKRAETAVKRIMRLLAERLMAEAA